MPSLLLVEPDRVAHLVLVALLLLAAFFALRPEIWGRIFFERVDPRPAGLLRIAFGLVTLWTFLTLLPLVRVLFTDEGLWLTDMARKRYGGPLAYLWDPTHGFEHWWGPIEAVLGRFTVLHLSSAPPFVYAMYGLTLASLGAMTVGLWTRWTTLLSWVLVGQLYRYSTIFYNGGDLVIQAFLFLAVLCPWGEAYSVDSWRRRRRAILTGATTIPSLRRIPAWPQRLMMLQLALIYIATGLSKSGETWRDGTALYYALNLDHFYRVPAQGLVTWLQYANVLPLLTWTTRWWEMLFPLALVGAALRGWEADPTGGQVDTIPRWRRRLSWGVAAAAWFLLAWLGGLAAARSLGEGTTDLHAPVTVALLLLPVVIVPAYRLVRMRKPALFRFIINGALGKRLWLGFGLALHAGIDLGVNVGTFSQVMVAVYVAWLSGGEVEALWRWLHSRPLRPGEGSRPLRASRWQVLGLAPVDRLVYRARGGVVTMLYATDEQSVRRAALLRCWDSGGHLRFLLDGGVPPGTVALALDRTPVSDPKASVALASALPGLWWLRAAGHIPGLRTPARRFALRLLGQR